MDTMKAFLSLKNSRIKFSTGEGDYEGILTRIAPEIELLVFSKLIWLPKNLKMGMLTFRAREISSFTVIEKAEVTETTEPTYKYAGLYEKDFQRPTIFDDDLDDVTSIDDSELNSILDEEEKEYIFNVPPTLKDLMPLDNVIIDKFDENFDSALRHLHRQDVIGFSLEGPKIGRFENIHWLCMSTVCCTFLFDINTLGDTIFSKGIREILEDPRIEKVVHDGREISNCLFHIYNTKLANVFDTQVANFIINAQRRKSKDGKILPYAQNLNSCLSHHLEIPEEFLFRAKKRSYQDQLVFYELRPLTEDLRDLFTKNVIYLRLLKKELDVLLMEPLDKCINVYMKSICGKTDRELELETFDPTVVPEELLYEEIQLFRFKDHVDIPAAVRSGPPYREFNDCFKNYVSYFEKIAMSDSDPEK